MLSVLDRYVLRSLLINYVVALGAMLSLYVVLDMFVNMDEFTEQGYPVGTVIRHIISFYVPNLLLYFSQLSGALTLFACMATLARMRTNNELTAILSSGVSLFRIAKPVLAFGVATTGLLVLDTEVLIPSVAHKLSRDHDDADGKRAYEVLFLRDRGGALLSAGQFDPITRDLKRLLVLTRDEDGNVQSTLEADVATWEPPGTAHPRGRWRLERARLTKRVRNDEPGFGPRAGRSVTYPRYYESDLSPEAVQVRQSEEWIRFLSLSQLSELEERRGPNLAAVVQMKHVRRTTPLISLIMLMLGLPFFLDRSPANVLSDAGKCMMVTGLCYVSTFIAQSISPTGMSLGEAATVGAGSALPLWIPIFVFGTLSVVLIDRIRT